VVGKAGKAVTLTTADKSVRRTPQPTITRAKNPIEGREVAVLNHIGESLVALAFFTGRLEQIFSTWEDFIVLVRRRRWRQEVRCAL